MKQKLLRLLPCMLIFMMVLTSCGSQQSQLTGVDWHVQKTVGFSGMDDMTPEQLYQVTFEFRNDGVVVGKAADQEMLRFQWSMDGDYIVWIIPGTAASSYYYTLSGDTLTMWNTMEYIRMVR